MEIELDSDHYVAVAKQLSNLRLREVLYRQALKKAQDEHGPQSLEVALIWLDLSDCLEAQGLTKQADDHAERAFSAFRQFLKLRPDLLPPGCSGHRQDMG